MTQPDFIINLGNGIYLDSSGKLTKNVDGVAQFPLSQPLPIPGSAVTDVFGGLGSVVPQLENLGAALGFQVKDLNLFEALGLTKEFAKVFASFSHVAGAMASVIPIVNFAAAMFNVFLAAQDANAMMTFIDNQFKRLYQYLDEVQRLKLDNDKARFISVYSLAETRIRSYQVLLSNPYSTPAEREQARNELKQHANNVRQTVDETLNYRWTLPLDPIQYYDNLGTLIRSQVIFTLPASAPPQPVAFPGPLPFDHRPMIPLFIYGLQTYLLNIKAVAPEYRTTGQYAADLRVLADKLSAQLAKMRDETLALTIYRAGIPYFRPSPRQWFVLGVGALDLRNDSDDYFRMSRNLADHPEWDRSGNLYRLWKSKPPVDIRGPQMPVGPELWWSINPAAVELANRQAERDYAALLTRSGYFTLAHLEAVMRHLSTEPDRSETVTGSVETWRKPLPASTVTVKNDQIPLSPPIEATASREPQDGKAYVSLTAQPVLHDRTVGYRIRLLTLPNGRRETPFDDYVSNEYIPLAGSPNRMLQVNVNSGLPLDPVGNNERQLVDSASPAQPLQLEGTAKLTADTFDWYVQVPDNPLRFEQIREGIRYGMSPGFGATPGPPPIPVAPSPPPLGDAPAISWSKVGMLITEPLDAGYGWKEAEQTWKGDRREWARTEIQISYKLYWHDDRLSIYLKPRPQDRNYVVYLVVEEFLAESQQWLRTPVQIRVNGQLTYVPKSFFDREAEARERVIKSIGRIEHNYRISRRPGPGDPVVSWLTPGIFESDEVMQEFITVVRQHAPDVIERALAEDGSAALKEGD